MELPVKPKCITTQSGVIPIEPWLAVNIPAVQAAVFIDVSGLSSCLLKFQVKCSWGSSEELNV